MCGLTGVLAKDLPATEVIRGMVDTLYHRGPDDVGVWLDHGAGVALGHRRLSIIELTTAGHQPMFSACGRYVIAFNGEIYNHNALREQLAAAGVAPEWRGHSDTETLLAGFSAWGVTVTLQRSVGMFAIALWDRAERRLILARDRFGEKPLYYGWVGGAFLFGSELKALRAYPGFNNPISRDSLNLYFQHSTVPAPYSIYQDIFKLEPGSILSLESAALMCRSFQISSYWRSTDAVTRGLTSLIQTETEAVAALESVLRESVAIQAVADVPLGAFLSGGVDSSTIVALMQAQSSRPIQTFTVGFDEARFDESSHAAAVAAHLGTEHYALRVTANDARAVIPLLSSMYDEPFADSSQIPMHLVCKAARSQVTVALSGDAGDELFGGYNRYIWGPTIWARMKWMPLSLRRYLASAMRLLPVAAWDSLGKAMPGSYGVAHLGNKVHKLARLTAVSSLSDVYRGLATEWPQSESLVLGANQLSTHLDDLSLEMAESEQLMMLLDTLTYLPDDILTKVDRAAMSVSLETRAPFLDHRVMELAWRLPLHMKIRNGQGKWALRQVLYKYVPSELIERPKTGFGIPLGQWLRGPLREWAEAMLNETRLQREGYFNPSLIRKVWLEHLNGRSDQMSRLWSVLMFQAWLEGNH